MPAKPTPAPPSPTLARELAALDRMTAKELRDKFAAVFGEPAASGNRAWLARRVGWRLQAQAEGDLSDRARARAAELARDADLRLTPPADRPAVTAAAAPARAAAPASTLDPRLPAPGTVLTRKYKGTVVRVKVQPDGLEYDGERYGSLSAVAKAVNQVAARVEAVEAVLARRCPRPLPDRRYPVLGGPPSHGVGPPVDPAADTAAVFLSPAPDVSPSRPTGGGAAPELGRVVGVQGTGGASKWPLSQAIFGSSSA